MGNHHHHHNIETKNIKAAFFINLCFAIIEIIGGIFTNSLAILSDALHDFGDSLGLGLAWYFQKIAQKEKDDNYTYGYIRYSLLGAIINSIILIIGSFFILKSAIPRLVNPEPMNTQGMFLLAILGIAVNSLAMWRLKQGHSHNEKVVALHFLEDILGWIAVLIGSVVIYFTNWYIIDPILSFIIACIIMFNVYRNIKSSIKIILQAVPENINIKDIQSTLLEIEYITSIHDIHIWSLDGNSNIMTAHIVTNLPINQQNNATIKAMVHEKLQPFAIEHITIEIENKDDFCSLDIEN
ncbi:MAG: cation transporter [Chitinophagales bacterium]|nr:cation transporter [Chitinophagales bacterium]